jgi:hypothetical protein
MSTKAISEVSNQDKIPPIATPSICSKCLNECLPQLISLQFVTVLVMGILGITGTISPVVFGATMLGAAGICFTALVIIDKEDKTGKYILIGQLAFYALFGGLTVGGVLPPSVTGWVIIGSTVGLLSLLSAVSYGGFGKMEALGCQYSKKEELSADSASKSV